VIGPLLVIDASAFLELLLRTPPGLGVERAIVDRPLAAPHLFDAEVVHRLVTFGKNGLLSATEVDVAIIDLLQAPITRIDQRPIMRDAQRLAHCLSGYDALYAAVAARLDAELLTTDERFARAATAQLGLRVLDLTPLL
jgi:predicted nucleic acid-binding protein